MGFESYISLILDRKIFDGNNDGIIAFGPNLTVDIDRTSGSAPGADQIVPVDTGGEINAFRYLGTKGGAHVYADARVRLAGMIEGTVANDSFNAGGGARTYLYDTALGLNLGGDTITNFGADDRIVTTTKIAAGSSVGDVLTDGSNDVFDLPGRVDGSSGNGTTQGGQIDLVGIDSLKFLSEQLVDGVSYYYYGLV